MDRWRRLLLAALVTVVAAGCGQASTQSAATAQGQAEHRFVHVHEFPDIGVRIAPPTGRPKLSWQQALQAVTRRNDSWPARSPPQVKLADYTSRYNGEGPVRPKLAWMSMGGPEFGPDGAPPAPRKTQRCPAYVVVDAASGRGWGAFQTCQPPYRG